MAKNQRERGGKTSFFHFFIKWGLIFLFQVGEAKKNMTADKLLRGMDKEFEAILNDLQGMHFRDAPDYEEFVSRLEAILKRKKYRLEDPFDWEAGGKC